jgi:hypothetical protein
MVGVQASIDFQNKKAEVRACLTSGCASYVENDGVVYVGIQDTQKDGVKVERSVTLRKREDYDELIHRIISGRLSLMWNDPRAYEAELLEALKYVEEKLKRGMRYVGLKMVYISARGIRVYFRLRYSEEDERPHMNVELIAEKDGERLNYQAYGDVNDYRPMLEEAAKAIAAYTLFSNFIYEQSSNQTNQSGGQQGNQQTA